jgi:CRISPR system Cascade subunit CasE
MRTQEATMYLSRAELARGAGAMAAWAPILKDHASFDRGHKLVWTLFAQGPETKRTFLWREVEPGSYIILSQEEPRDETKLWRIATKRFEPELSPGDRLAFSLRANPAVAVSAGPGRRGMRADAVMHAKRPAKEREAGGVPALDAAGREKAALGWLFKREERLGVIFDRELCSMAGYGVIRAGGSPNGGEISFASADFEGVLQVQKPADFTDALAKGIGKAKAYGCGLMLIRRV